MAEYTEEPAEHTRVVRVLVWWGREEVWMQVVGSMSVS
jgi:hypothetical protein